MTLTTLGERIREKRKFLGITQSNLASMIGVTRAVISKYESGTITNIPHYRIVQLANALDVSPSYLLDCEKEANEKNSEEFKNLLKNRRIELKLTLEEVGRAVGVKMNIGERIKNARIRKKLTQRELAIKINKTFSSVQKYELNIIQPPIDVIFDLATALDVSPAYLMGWEEPNNKREYFIIPREIWAIMLKLKPKDRGIMLDYIFKVAFGQEWKE